MQTIDYYITQFIETLRHKSYAKYTLYNYTHFLKKFARFLFSRQVKTVTEVTTELVEEYARVIYTTEKSSGEKISVSHQRALLTVVISFFRWLLRTNVILHDPAKYLALPKKEQRLIKDVLTRSEVKRILAQPEVTRKTNRFPLRDKAILELLYSTGIRNSELCSLHIDDIDFEKSFLIVRQGKGSKQRVVPVGQKACEWLALYLQKARPYFLLNNNSVFLFLNKYGKAIEKNMLTMRVRRYIKKAGVMKSGSCHLFRHTCATHMLEGGCDIRYIQELLGHVELTTTQIYTRVNPLRLREVYRQSFFYGALHEPL